MKNKFKYLALATLAMAAMSCGKKDAQVEMTNEPVEITVQADTMWLPYYQEVKEKIEKEHPNATINIMEIGAFDMLDKLDKTDASNPDVADVFAYPLDRLMGLYGKDTLASFDAKKIADAVGGFGDYDKGLGGQLKIDDSYLGFPFNIETLVAFVNLENAKAQGIDLSQKVELIQKNANTISIPIFNAWFGVSLTNAGELELLGKKDGKFYSDLTKDYDELSDKQKSVVNQMFDYWKLATEQKTTLFDKDAVWGYIDEHFKDGKDGVFRIDGPWATPNLVKLTSNLDVLPLGNITVGGEMLKHWKGGWALGVNARLEEDANKLQLAETLIKELMNRDNAVKFFEITGKIMPNVTKETYLASELDDTNKKVIASVIDSYSESVSRPLFEEWGQVWDTYQNGILSWNSAKPKDAKAAYNELSSSFKAMMQNIQK